MDKCKSSSWVALIFNAYFSLSISPFSNLIINIKIHTWSAFLLISYILFYTNKFSNDSFANITSSRYCTLSFSINFYSPFIFTNSFTLHNFVMSENSTNSSLPCLINILLSVFLFPTTFRITRNNFLELLR